ncbi:histidinol dehydrogenase [Dongia sp.]|uniref:histidinol dehydrogenase n=1 Tax=Dongia sp. TaxID=1977262 RepID=UPI0035B45129
MASSVNLHELARLSPEARSNLLKRSEADLGAFLDRVKPIIAAVKDEGDVALARFANEFDKSPVKPAEIAATQADFDAAFKAVEPEVIAAIEFAVENIRNFHSDQKPEEMWLHEMRAGAFAGDRFLAIPSVACYVPRGKGSFPSVVMMTTIPAVVAGVKNICVVTPPGPDGKIDAATLVAARLAGVDKVFKCGGAQGVAAVAYGTQTVPRCAKIVGPGSPFVVAAKRLLADVIDPGIPAGPSESIIFADETVDGRLAALDLLVEAEHGPDSSAYLVTSSAKVAQEAIKALPDYWARMSEQRVAFSTAVLTGPRGGVVLAPDVDAAMAFINDYAPEHLEILSDEPFAYLGRIENAGEVLLGKHTPVTLGNFVLGPNAVLPTSRAAMTHSPLSVFDFMKRISVGYVTSVGYPTLAKHARVLATYEGFDAHANAVSEIRDRLLKR